MGLGKVAAGGAELLVGVARWKMLMESVVDLSVVTVFPSLSVVGSWEKVLLWTLQCPRTFWSLCCRMQIYF